MSTRLMGLARELVKGPASRAEQEAPFRHDEED